MIPTPIRRKRYLAVGAGLAGLAVLAALPSAAAPDMEAVFKRLDKNGDGVVTAQEFWGEEVSAGLVAETRNLVRHDAETGEPVVSRDSFAVLQPPGMAPDSRFSAGEDWGVRMMIGLRISQRARDDDPRAHEFVGMDANRDNTISLEEYRVRLRAMLSRGFELLDTDKDGFLTAAEFAFSDEDEILSSRLYGGGKSDCPYKDCERKWTLPEGVLVAGFAALDRDGDKLVSLREYLAKT